MATPDAATPELYLGILHAFTSNADAENDTRANSIDLASFILSLELPSGDAGRETLMTRRLPAMLNALAAICLHGKPEVYATSISITKEKVTLYVAENNNPVSNIVVQHLEKPFGPLSSNST